jgi:hypothetical protein
LRRSKHEVWTQEKADERAMGSLVEMQLSDEAISEFLLLSKEYQDVDEEKEEEVKSDVFKNDRIDIKEEYETTAT